MIRQSVYKELLIVLRDRRTLLINIFVPLIFFPVLLYFANSNIEKAAELSRELGFATEASLIGEEIKSILPMLLVMFSTLGASALVTDLCVGEKERGTLEPLLTTRIKRGEILAGKLAAISASGVVSIISAFLGVSLFGFIAGKTFDFHISELTAAFVFLLLHVIVIASISVCVSFSAKSVKSSQSSLLPLTLLSLIPSYVTSGIDVSNIPGYYFFIPVLNTSCALKELSARIFSGVHAASCIFSSAVISLIFILLSKKFLDNERIIL